MKTFMFAFALCTVMTCATASPSSEPQLFAWPVACDLGRTCFIQNYVDHDPSDKTLDFRCGRRTYDGHDGTDIRLPDLDVQRTGVAVVAAASGRVAHTRDGMDDVSVKVAGKAAVAGRECGNGAVVEHGNGWSTQYCHMAKGSLRVKPGDSVSAGQTLGLVGLSGNTELPHLHFTVRQSRAVVDPFAEGRRQRRMQRWSFAVAANRERCSRLPADRDHQRRFCRSSGDHGRDRGRRNQAISAWPSLCDHRRVCSRYRTAGGGRASDRAEIASGASHRGVSRTGAAARPGPIFHFGWTEAGGRRLAAWHLHGNLHAT
ncbi:hypothetical protein ACVWYQ_002615 [Bradyrhizobium sp. USDA 3397]